MRTPPDPVDLLRTLPPDPGARFEPDAPAARARLERLLAEPRALPSRPRASRRATRRKWPAAAVVAAIVAAVAGPAVRQSPDVIAQAADALNDSGTILHFRAQVRFRSTPSELRSNRPDGRIDHTMELWQTAGARQERLITDGENECSSPTSTASSRWPTSPGATSSSATQCPSSSTGRTGPAGASRSPIPSPGVS